MFSGSICVYYSLFFRVSDAFEIEVPTAYFCVICFDRCRVIRVLSFLILALHTQTILVEHRLYSTALKRATTPVTFRF